jgi:hypothetical protein
MGVFLQCNLWAHCGQIASAVACARVKSDEWIDGGIRPSLFHEIVYQLNCGGADHRNKKCGKKKNSKREE